MNNASVFIHQTMDETQFISLLAGFKQGKLSAADLSQFRSALESGQFDYLLRSDIEAELNEKIKDPAWTGALKAKTLKSIQLAKDVSVKKMPGVTPWPRTFWIKYAAAIIMVLGVTAYFYSQRKGRLQNFQVAQNIIRPGGDKAILTLADGTSVILDSASNGRLAMQGSSQVIQKDGQLIYSIDRPNSAASATPIPEYNVMETPHGGQYRLMLPDGSQVWLNAASRLRYPVAFTGHNREVELTGEAYFEITENKSAPFVVKTQKLSVNVLGTGFNVNAYEDEPVIATTLVHGSVKVVSASGTALVQPGQQVAIDNATLQMKTSTPNLDNVLAWKEGKFHFDGASIYTIMRQISRWYDVHVVYQGNIPETAFDGSLLRTAYPTSLLHALELTKEIHFRIDGKTITVIAGPKT